MFATNNFFKLNSPLQKKTASQQEIFWVCIDKKMWEWKEILKVYTNEKRDGLRVVSFDRSSFKLFSLKISNKSVQAPFCERPKTTQRTLFLLFANNNYFK